MANFSERLQYAMNIRHLTQTDLCNMTKIPKSAMSQYISGAFKPKDERTFLLAKALDVNEAWLMGYDVSIKRTVQNNENSIFSINGISPLPKTNKKPRLGTIACGEPILAEENIEDYDDVPDVIKCDFTLVCKGDSMINARINDGDIVYIKQQSAVDNGEIAAVLIDNEATLKRVYVYDDKVILQPENAKYPPFVYSKEEMNNIRILGKAVGFTSRI